MSTFRSSLRLSLTCAACLFVAGVVSGCGLMKMGRETSAAAMKEFAPNGSHGYRDPAEEVDDQWAFVGQQGRGNMPVSSGGDPWYSPKARSIERNLGYE